MVPYGAERVEAAPVEALAALGLEPRAIRARRRASRTRELDPRDRAGLVRSAARRIRSSCSATYESDHRVSRRRSAPPQAPNVRFPGALYDPAVVQALRHHARLYVHGHTVGGTNPSLVEALGAGSPVLAHDNVFNRWVAGPGARFFTERAGVRDGARRRCSTTRVRSRRCARQLRAARRGVHVGAACFPPTSRCCSTS